MSACGSNIGKSAQWLWERFVAAQGTTVLLPGGKALKALIKDDDHELIRRLTNEGDAPPKPPLVLVFGGSAWGVVLENMKVIIGTGAMARNYRVAAPLHPKWRQDIVTELAVVVFPE